MFQDLLYEALICSTGVCTDSRKLQQDNLFFALKGENFDGNQFARKALELGASYVVVDRESEVGREVAKEIPYDFRFILVDDVLTALQRVARKHRSQFNIPVIGLTGTNGKTTTKELLNVVLSTKYKVSATVGNLNNSIGVPLTLLSFEHDTQIAVVELGASHPGDIKELVEIALPTFGLITNVGKAHLQGFGSFEGVKQTKGELYDYLQLSADMAFYNIDNRDICAMVSQRPDLKVSPYGLSCKGAQVLPVTAQEPFLRISFPESGLVLNTNLVGSYNADNVMAALAVGEWFKVPFEDACHAIEGYHPTNSRSELRKTEHNTLVVDTYNANPSSMLASLQNFESTEFVNKIVILGDMRELGAHSYQEHEAIMKVVMGMNLKRAIFVGEEFMACKGSLNAGFKTDFFLNVDELNQSLSSNPIANCTLLLKGSNSIGLQSVVKKLF